MSFKNLVIMFTSIANIMQSFANYRKTKHTKSKALFSNHYRITNSINILY